MSDVLVGMSCPAKRCRTRASTGAPNSVGSQTFGTYEGAVKTVSNPDGSCAATWEGTYKYTGGSGKFKNIKGAGTYSGKASSAGDLREDAKETVE